MSIFLINPVCVCGNNLKIICGLSFSWFSASCEGILFCVHCHHVRDFNRCIITCWLPVRDPPAENIHISSLPPSVPTDPEPQPTGAQGEDVCFVDFVAHRSFIEMHEAFQLQEVIPAVTP